MLGQKMVIAAAMLGLGSLAGGVALAQEVGEEAGLYVRGYGGISTLADTEIRVAGLEASGSFSSGLLVGGAVGYDYAGPWRAELEYTYRSGEVGRLPAGFARDGDYASTAIMVNGLYSFGEEGRLRPYLGLGIGVTREVDFDLTSGPAAPPPFAVGEYSTSGRLAYQVLTGAELAFSEGWSGFGEIRAFAIDSPRLAGSGRTLTADYQTIDFLVGVSRRF
ncbi:MAG: outer membrane protein [Hyphomonas sp.]